MRKAGPAREIPPPLEMLCLKALWSLREGHVRDVQRALAGQRPLAYTTVMTLLERLVRKGAATRRKVGRAFLYVPQASRETMRRLALKQFLELYFDGSEDELRQLLSNRAATEPPEEPPETPMDAALL
jgi:predicted transcriptional regulator